MHGAVAIDLGATSGRFAAGRLVDGRIEFEIIEQIPHSPLTQDGRLVWDLDALMGLVGRAASYASTTFGRATIGIDSWGVDHGFVDQRGELIQPPVCYRDPSITAMFEVMAPHRPRLYELTGIQHQPFNTVVQLAARLKERPTLADETHRWMILPDLMGFLLTGEANHELTQASTTQLLGLDDRWSAEALAIAGWPMPDLQPSRPGQVGGYVAEGVRLATVGSHDTGSAVCGFGDLQDDEMFLNVGTWSLVGCVIDRPIATPDAERANFSNERTVDGRVRFLRNVPGFWVINRLHEDLGVAASVPEWLKSAKGESEGVLDLFHDELFNPDSMLDACSSLISHPPTTAPGWADLALRSLTTAISNQRAELERITGRTFRAIRVGGGGSRSSAFCQSLATQSGLRVMAGAAEATVLGNLAMQFLAQGEFKDFAELRSVVDRSTAHVHYS